MTTRDRRVEGGIWRIARRATRDPRRYNDPRVDARRCVMTVIFQISRKESLFAQTVQLGMEMCELWLVRDNFHAGKWVHYLTLLVWKCSQETLPSSLIGPVSRSSDQQSMYVWLGALSWCFVRWQSGRESGVSGSRSVYSTYLSTRQRRSTQMWLDLYSSRPTHFAKTERDVQGTKTECTSQHGFSLIMFIIRPEQKEYKKFLSGFWRRSSSWRSSSPLW